MSHIKHEFRDVARANYWFLLRPSCQLALQCVAACSPDGRPLWRPVIRAQRFILWRGCPRITRSLSSGRPNGSGLWPARWQAPAGPGGSIRASVQESPRLLPLILRTGVGRRTLVSLWAYRPAAPRRVQVGDRPGDIRADAPLRPADARFPRTRTR